MRPLVLVIGSEGHGISPELDVGPRPPGHASARRTRRVAERRGRRGTAPFRSRRRALTGLPSRDRPPMPAAHHRKRGLTHAAILHRLRSSPVPGAPGRRRGRASPRPRRPPPRPRREGRRRRARAARADKTLYAIGLVISPQPRAASSCPPRSSRSSSRASPTASSARPRRSTSQTYGPKLNELAKSRIGGRGRRREEGRRRVPREGSRAARRVEAAVRLRLQGDEGRHRRDAEGDRQGQGPLQGHADRRHRLRQLDRPQRARRRSRSTASSPAGRRALQLMKEGGSARLVCPSELAYGDEGRPAADQGRRDARVRRPAPLDREVRAARRGRSARRSDLAGVRTSRP